MKLSSVFDKNLGVELEVIIGENALDNWNIISISNRNDLWFHIDGLPSSHIILQVPKKYINKIISEQTLLYCSELCKKHSRYKNNKNIKVIYTEIKNITKGNKAGEVIAKQTKII